MKHIKHWGKIALLFLFAATAILLSSCKADMNIGNNTELGEYFITSVLDNDYDAAYALVESTVTPADFHDYWTMMRSVTKGATSYEMEQVGWNINTTNGITTRTTAYQVYFDNEKTVLLRIVTNDDIAGIAGLHFSDITDFVTTTNAYVPTVNVILFIASLLSIAFSIWMFIDCLRRKIKYKVLWAILTFCGVGFTLTFGKTGGLHFMAGLMFQINQIVADPGIMSVKINFIVPLGAILYFFLRKKTTVASNTAHEAAQTVQYPTTFFEPTANTTPPANETDTSMGQED
ncbi:MAG: hypothetical protein IKA06_06715 [Clostridia bacterium]|nr:hypothetical protein [Clostridia bacterium]